MIKTCMLQSYPDQRGEVYPSWTKTGGAIGEDIELVEDRFSRSTKGVIRGFHGDPLTWKLCMCVYGSLKLVAWDIKNSKRYSFVIRDDSKTQVLIPPYYLNAHQCLTKECILHYKWSHPSSLENQWSVHYNDSTINPQWSLSDSIISERDKNAVSLETFLEELHGGS